MEGAGAETHLGHGAFHELTAGIVQFTEFPNLAGSHVGVGKEVGLFEASCLPFPCCFDPRPNLG